MKNSNTIEEKKSLMNSVYRLDKTTNKFVDLIKVSNALLSKLNRTEDQPIKCIKSINEYMADSEKVYSIVDLLNMTDDRLNDMLCEIMVNLERAIFIIE